MKLSRAAQVSQGRLMGDDADFAGLSIDSRDITAGDLFVAIRGERFDGHEFAVAASNAGAVAVVVERADEQLARQLVVPDSRRALGLIARELVAHCGARRIAVTGNSGKTTVKEMIATMLGERVHATRGNFNNDIGVPLTLLDLEPAHRFAVFELGANAPGEIAWTSSLVAPEVALITNVTGAHLEGFGSMEGIAAAKSEIFMGMQPGGTAIINMDDGFSSTFADAARQRQLSLVRVAIDAEADLSAMDLIQHDEGTTFDLLVDGQRQRVEVPLPGLHQVSNALMALAVVHALGESLDAAIERLRKLVPVKGRMAVSRVLSGTLVDDTYNANPGSVRAAIDWLSARSGKRLLVLGDMGELGSFADDLHRQAGEYARDKGLDGLVTVGPLSAVAGAAFGNAAAVCDSHEAAVDVALPVLEQGGTVLVKGSRSAGMEAVVQYIHERGDLA